MIRIVPGRTPDTSVNKKPIKNPRGLASRTRRDAVDVADDRDDWVFLCCIGGLGLGPAAIRTAARVGEAVRNPQTRGLRRWWHDARPARGFAGQVRRRWARQLLGAGGADRDAAGPLLHGQYCF